MSMVLVLAVLAATLGAGGYLAYRRISLLVAQVALGATKAFVTHVAVQSQMAAAQSKMADALDQIAKRPSAATIAHRVTDLVPVHGMQSIVGQAIVPARSEAPIIMAPQRADVFQVKAMRVVAWAEGHPALEQRVRIIGAEINQSPQFDWSKTWGYGGTNREHKGVVSDLFATPSGYAVGVSIAPCTTANLVQTLEVTVYNDNPYPVRVCIEGYGEAVHPPRDASVADGT